MDGQGWDVVVVGAGPGGMAAAVEAARAGARVLVLEALQEIGGNAVWSTGYLAFADFAMQHDAGISDSAARFLDDARAEVELQRARYGIMWDEALTRLFAENSADTYRFLTELGVRFNRFIRRPKQHTVDRMVDVVDTFMFQRAFLDAFATHGVTVRNGTRVERLITHNRRVVGVRAAGPDGPDEIRADAVILAAGGYQGSADVRRRYQPERMAATPYLGVPTCRGDGHRMGQSVGGDLLNMTMVQPLVIVGSALVEDSIAVNRAGRRFHDEAGPYDDRVAALARQPDGVAFYVFDDEVGRRKQHLVAQMPHASVRAASLAELADTIGCDPTGLSDSVAEWNASLGSEEPSDPWGRVVLPSGHRGIVTAPFHASPMVIGVNFPAGGLRVTLSMAVVDVFGEVIAGLYAAGDCVGGVNPCLGLGGIHISSAFTLGRVAGKSAALGETGEPHPLPPLDDPPAPRGTVRMAIVDVPSP